MHCGGGGPDGGPGDLWPRLLERQHLDIERGKVKDLWKPIVQNLSQPRVYQTMIRQTRVVLRKDAVVKRLVAKSNLSKAEVRQLVAMTSLAAFEILLRNIRSNLK